MPPHDWEEQRRRLEFELRNTLPGSAEERAIRDQLERILASDEFRASDKQRTFLSFVVDETLADRSSQLKGYTVAVSVYGRPEGFDPQVDPIVRVEAG